MQSRELDNTKQLLIRVDDISDNNKKTIQLLVKNF